LWECAAWFVCPSRLGRWLRELQMRTPLLWKYVCEAYSFRSTHNNTSVLLVLGALHRTPVSIVGYRYNDKWQSSVFWSTQHFSGRWSTQHTHTPTQIGFVGRSQPGRLSAQTAGRVIGSSCRAPFCLCKAHGSS
jgi:hypothetical protein